jgi:3-hydroxyisobutyrate dehydrogenase
MPEKIAFLGLGAMGFGMATNLVKKGLLVTGYDVWAPTLERFVSAGGSSAKTPRETVKGAEFVILMVATAAQVMTALFHEENGAILELEKGATVILCSTGPPEYTPNVRKTLDQKGRSDVFLVDAPVSGGTIRAANGTLTILAAGEDSALGKAKEVLQLMAGSNLYIIPGGLGAGTNVKMVHQVLAGIHICMANEAMGFAAAMGVDTKRAFEVLKASEGTSWMFENRVPHMLVEDKTVYSALNIIVKDIVSMTLRIFYHVLTSLPGNCYCWWKRCWLPLIFGLGYGASSGERSQRRSRSHRRCCSRWCLSSQRSNLGFETSCFFDNSCRRRQKIETRFPGHGRCTFGSGSRSNVTWHESRS